jgi:formate C-acetyltransferase
MGQGLTNVMSIKSLLNLSLPHRGTRPDALLTLIEGFFGGGGWEMQLNASDSEALWTAQIHPEHYGDLVVRVAGLSARFIDLAPLEQQELIERAEAYA